MGPVAYEYRIPRFVPVGTRGTVNKQGTGSAIGILKRIMTVVPGMTVLGRLEVVRISVVCSNGTLRHTVDSIGSVCMELTDTVPMDCTSIVWMKIGNMHGLG